MIDPQVTAFLLPKPWYAGIRDVTDENGEVDTNIGGAEVDEELDPAPMSEGEQKEVFELGETPIRVSILEDQSLLSAQSSAWETQPMRSSSLPYADREGNRFGDRTLQLLINESADPFTNDNATLAKLDGRYGKGENDSSNQRFVSHASAAKRFTERAEEEWQENLGRYFERQSRDFDRESFSSGYFTRAVEHAPVKQTVNVQSYPMPQQQKAKAGRDEAKFQSKRKR